jgi:hypothetical protein
MVADMRLAGDIGPRSILCCGLDDSVNGAMALAMRSNIHAKGDGKQIRCTFQRRGTRFQEEDIPPSIPVDPFLRLEGTAAWIDNSSALDVGNDLLKFLSEEVSVVDFCSNPKKFSVKAKAVVDGLACEVKVRMYWQDESCAVEFQRQAGDQFLFNNLYVHACEFLKSCASLRTNAAWCASTTCQLGPAHTSSNERSAIASPPIQSIGHTQLLNSCGAKGTQCAAQAA